MPVNLLRIKHWIKNLVVFIPLFFSLSFFSKNSVLFAIIGFIAFCLISSSVYILNDIIDLDEDRKHPVKKYRPIANGDISIKLSLFLSFLLASSALIISLKINLYAVSVILLYFFLNVIYSYCLKYIPIIDIVCIALGFILRILLGCAVINVEPSALVILLTFFTSMFFTFSKRKLEFSLYSGSDIRKSLQGYNEAMLNNFVSVNAILSIAFYFTYMLEDITVKRAGSPYIYVSTIPFAVIIFRLLFLVYTKQENEDPSVFIYKDRILHILFFIYILTYASILLLSSRVL